MTSDSNLISNHVGSFFFILLCISTSFKLCCSILVCPEIEKQALLKFKNSLNDTSNMLSSWNISREDNCCKWKGVVCSNLTGHVHQLRLHNPDYSKFGGLIGELNPSLLNLKELKYLDLSLNEFGVRVPSFLGFLTSLEHLNLSFAEFHGTIPRNIGNLSNLHTLSLDSILIINSDDGFGIVQWRNNLDVDNMEWVSGLSQLEYLNMNGVILGKVATWVQVINTLPSLVELHLSDCGLNSMAPLKHVNTTSLAILDLSYNNFDSLPMPRWIFQLPSLEELHLRSCGFSFPLTLSDVNTSLLAILDLSGNEFYSYAMPKWIFQLSNLIFLDLSDNSFKVPIPSVKNTTKLKFINLSGNQINSSIPNWLYFCKDLEHVFLRDAFLRDMISNAIVNLTSLRTLDLSFNELSGNIPRGIASLCKMQELDLSMNNLRGEVSDAFGNMSECFLEALKSLDLSRNSISGAIPFNIGKLFSLSHLRIGYNKLSGNLPESVGKLLNLEVLDIEHNMLEGTVTETHFSNLSKLEVLSASGNHLSLKISSNWVPPFTLYKLTLGSWNLGTDNIPSWIQMHKGIFWLDLSNTGVSGNIPTWFWEISILNLSHNNLHGQIPYIISNEVFLSSNQFSGLLPRIASSVSGLDLSNNSFTGGISHILCDTTYQAYGLEILHLGGNQLTGELPDCFMKWPYLIVLNLANNNLFGKIPDSIGFLGNMLSLNLQGNKFWGQIPFSMHNCTNLLKLDLGGNDFSGNIPPSMGTSLKFLILRSNRLSGEIHSHICHLRELQILDLSHNGFSGVIPKCVNNFTAMMAKRTMDQMVPNLDYSRNVTGNFFESASVATKGREYIYETTLLLVTNIDLSNNNLSGVIPKELTNLVGLISLNLSGNHLRGSIPDSMGDMKQLESLDLSRNSLLGEIPNSFTHMFYLSYLDLSFNNLTGRIPSSTQIMGMNASNFVGNHLCGPPLPNNCSDPSVDANVHEDADDGGESKIERLYVFLSLGYAVGLSACCTALVLKKSWRDAYFGLLECIWDKLCVYFCIKWTRHTTTRAPTS